MLEYQLTDEVSVRELDGVRPGTSYKDLATDLECLAVLAENHPAEIAGDRHFVATDPADARTLSDAILADLWDVARRPRSRERRHACPRSGRCSSTTTRSCLPR